LSETGRPVVCKTSHPVGKNHFHDSETGRPGVFKGRTESLSDSDTFHSKEQTVDRVAGFRARGINFEAHDLETGVCGSVMRVNDLGIFYEGLEFKV